MNGCAGHNGWKNGVASLADAGWRNGVASLAFEPASIMSQIEAIGSLASLDDGNGTGRRGNARGSARRRRRAAASAAISAAVSAR
jgi:hypothetical protein